MSNSSVIEIDQLFRCFAKADSDCQDAERCLQYDQARYAEVGKQYLASNPYEANHELMEAMRSSRNASRAKRDSAQADAHALAWRVLTELCALPEECAGNEALMTLRRRALAVKRRQGVQLALGMLIVASGAIVVVLLAKAFYMYAVLSIFATMVLASVWLRIARSELSEILFREVLRYASNELQYPVEAAKQHKEDAAAPTSDVLKTSEFQQFDKKFRASLAAKDRGALASALRLRQDATALVRHMPALYCVGKHHEMIIEYNHIGWGVEARLSAQESMKYEPEYQSLSLALFPMFQANCLQESLELLACCATSYEEALRYSERLNAIVPNATNRRHLEELEEMQRKHSRWYSTQRAILNSFYSRASQELDHGRYAGGLTVIDVILANAHNPGYTLDQEEYADLLDDMCALAMQLLMQKMELRPPRRSASEDASELGCILRKPLMYLADFFPECSPKNRDLFSRHYQAIAQIPWIDSVPGWNHVSGIMGSPNNS